MTYVSMTLSLNQAPRGQCTSSRHSYGVTTQRRASLPRVSSSGLFYRVTPRFSWLLLQTIFYATSLTFHIFPNMIAFFLSSEQLRVLFPDAIFFFFLLLGICFHSSEDILLRAHQSPDLIWTECFLGLLHNSCTAFVFIEESGYSIS